MALRSRPNPLARTFMPVENTVCSASSVPGASSRPARTAISSCLAVISSSLSMSSERESRVGSFMMVETCLPRTTESSMAAPTPSKYVRYVSTLRLCWQLRAHQAMPNTTTKRTAARMAMRWMRVRRRSGRRRDEGADGGPPASAGARLFSSSKKSTPRTPRF